MVAPQSIVNALTATAAGLGAVVIVLLVVGFFLGAPAEDGDEPWRVPREPPEAAGGTTSPVHASADPRNQGQRQEERGGAMENQQVGPETKGVTVKLLAAVDLGPEIEGMAGRQLRMRMVTMEPGGVFGPIHDHKGRPGTVYILQGTITDHRDGVATDYGPGVGWPEDRNTTHWLENRGTVPAVEISVDIVRQE